MSTTLPGSDRTFWQRWKDFWFAPRDPTTLGFMRLMTGLLIIYIHLAYSLDLQGFFGKYGWYAADYAERERKEFPWGVSSFWEWDDQAAMARIPEFPHRRQAVLAFIRGLPADRGTRGQALRYFNRAVAFPNNSDTLVALEYVRQMGPSDSVWKGHKQRLLQAVPADDVARDIPVFFRNLPRDGPNGRAEIAEEVEAFLAVLPKDKPGDTPQQRGEHARDHRYILNHLMELGQPERRAMADYLTNLPDDAAKRKQLIDYLEHWNSDPRKATRRGHSIFSIWFHVTDPTQMAIVHTVILIIMVLFTAGFCTRVTSVLTWMAAMCYIQRAQQVLFGMDTMMNILLFYLMIGNSGAALSVDRLIARYRAARASLRRTGTIDPSTRAFLTTPPPTVGANIGIRLIQIHFCFIYLAAGLSKLKGPAWWYGSAFWDVMANPEFTLIRYHWYENMLRAMVSIKPLYYITTALGVWFTWGLEISFPFLIWTRLRPIFLWMGILLHAGIGVLMGLNLFELLMMVMLLSFMPAVAIRERLRGGPDLRRFTLAYNAANAAQARAAATVVAADIDGQVSVEAKQGTATPIVTPAGGTAVTGRDVVSTLSGSLRLLRVFRWVPGIRGILTRGLAPTAGGPSGTGTKPGPQAPAAAS